MTTVRPMLAFFLAPTKPLQSHGQARPGRAGDTVLVKTREMTGRSQTLPWVAGGRRGKDDRKQVTLALLGRNIS